MILFLNFFVVVSLVFLFSNIQRGIGLQYAGLFFYNDEGGLRSDMEFPGMLGYFCVNFFITGLIFLFTYNIFFVNFLAAPLLCCFGNLFRVIRHKLL